MKNYLLRILFVNFVVCQSCAQPKTENTSIAGDKPAPGNVVLIFEKTTNPSKTLIGTFNLDKEKLRAMRIGESIRQNTIEFATLNEFNDEQSFLVNNYDRNDTIMVNATQPVSIFLNAYPGMLTYRFLPGDTVHFSNTPRGNTLPDYAQKIYAFPNELVYCAVQNRQAGKADQSYPLLKRAMDGLYFFEQDEAKFQRHNAVLDSLKKDGSLSQEYYDLYRNTLKFEYLGRFLQKKELFGKYFSYSDLKQDELLQVQPYRQFLRNYVSQSVMQNKNIKISGGISMDFKKAYDSIQQKFEGDVRDYLLLSCVKSMKGIETPQVQKTYADRLLKDMNSEAFTQYYTAAYAAAPAKSTGNKNMLKAAGNAAPVDMNELLKKEKGKVVYVDLWASWCIPCRAAMPASEKLREEYKNAKVSFVYLSIDEKPLAWEIAARAEKLLNYSNSYLLTDPKNAPLIKAINLQSIPRYLVYDKNGTLVNQNAPGPDNKEVRQLLDKYLAQ